MNKLADLRRKLGEVIEEMNDPKTIEDGAKFDEVVKRKADIEGQISRTQIAEAARASSAKPAGGQNVENIPEDSSVDDAGGIFAYRESLGRNALNPDAPSAFVNYVRAARKGLGHVQDNAHKFRNFGEQLQAVFRHYQSRGSDVDARLVRAPTGAGEVDPTGGGFLVQVDFASAIFMLAHDMGEILSRVNKIPISASSNGLKIPGIDETSRVTGSRWGGVQSNWVGEGQNPGASKPKFKLVEFDLKKLMSVAYITDELLQDSTALTGIYGQAFSEEVMFMTEDAIFEGDGVGKPLGIMNSPALIKIAAEAGQKPGTFLKENVDNMWSRMWSRSRKNAIWTNNQDIEPQLSQMNQAVGTGGQLVYLPPGGLASAPNSTLNGRQLVSTEYNAALGAPGDITLFDLSQYTLVDKNSVQMASSMHVAFLTDEMAFRITYRVDGKPMWSVPLTPFKGALTKSPFIAMAQR